MTRLWRYLAGLVAAAIAVVAGLVWWRGRARVVAITRTAGEIAAENERRAREQAAAMVETADAQADAEVEHGRRTRTLADYLRSRDNN